MFLKIIEFDIKSLILKVKHQFNVTTGFSLVEKRHIFQRSRLLRYNTVNGKDFQIDTD